MKPHSKREYLRDLVAAKARWNRALTDEEKRLGFLGWHERGYLPHCDYPGLVQFITFRLDDSLPESRRGEWEHLLKIEDVRDKRSKLEEYLDRGIGECYLRNSEIAWITEQSLLHFNTERYELLAWCIMPNHVHVFVHVWQTPMSKLIQCWKIHVTKEVHRLKLLDRTPRRDVDPFHIIAPSGCSALHDFWQREYWDTFMREEKQERKAIRYIENNSVKAKLCATAEEWPFSSARFRDQKSWKLVLSKRDQTLRMSAQIKIAAEIISKSDREHPADSVLRAELKRQKGLTRSEARDISRAVFNYFRWFGWLDSQKPIAGNIFVAQELAERFSREPNRFSDEELRDKAIPSWTNECVAVSPEWLRALQSEPKLWLRAKHGQAQRIAEILGSSFLQTDTLLHDAIEYRGTEDLFRTAEFQNGDFELQDISSQAVSVICDPKPGETWWDACAGEGGKLLHLSELMSNKGLIWASDRAEWRLKRLKQRTARAKVFNYRAVTWDGGAKLPTKTKFDGVLVDAPCSGIGTWTRNPQARWTASLNDVRELGEVQRTLLLRAADSVKPGGKLIYSVCTLSNEETIAVAEFFKNARKDFQPLELKNPFKPGEAANQLWFLPQSTGGNGMFVAGWKRV